MCCVEQREPEGDARKVTKTFKIYISAEVEDEALLLRMMSNTHMTRTGLETILYQRLHQKEEVTYVCRLYILISLFLLLNVLA